MKTETKEVWAKFCLAHPHLYTEEFKNSGYWLYCAPVVGVR